MYSKHEFYGSNIKKMKEMIQIREFLRPKKGVSIVPTDKFTRKPSFRDKVSVFIAVRYTIEIWRIRPRVVN